MHRAQQETKVQAQRVIFRYPLGGQGLLGEVAGNPL